MYMYAHYVYVHVDNVSSVVLYSRGVQNYMCTVVHV